MRYLLLSLIVLFSGISLKGQEVLELNESQKAQIIKGIVEKLDDFQFWLGDMADKQNPSTVRKGAHSAAKKLFVGKCQPYTLFVSGISVNNDGVKMQTSSVRNGREIKKDQLMRNYFLKILNNTAYNNIKIEQSKAVRVDNVRKVGEGKYEAVAHIHQYFTGYGGERNQVLYSDNTEKDVRIHIDYEEIPTSEGVDRIISIKLGDMTVVFTERIK